MTKRDVGRDANKAEVLEVKGVTEPALSVKPADGVIDAMLGNISFGGTIGAVGTGGTGETGGSISPNVRTAPDGQVLPTVEIYATQLDVIFFQGQPFTYILTGACYDRSFSGRLVIEPAFPESCNVFLGGPPAISLQFPPNAQIQVAITLFSTQRTGLTFVSCGLRYKAFHRYFLNGQFVEQDVSKGNLVSFKYRVKRPPRFPGDVEP